MYIYQLCGLFVCRPAHIHLLHQEFENLERWTRFLWKEFAKMFRYLLGILIWRKLKH